ncbi:carotenoid ester lipase [Lentinus tigrinus ALCF2SS1-7]|uniref:Carboxylic ester hydrolase n=1 Tax=Lentinus tigrinus ALCF2SS1-6 TaxID=1328759 RepID=A0A5C2SBM3_9APHY|nr:carotenoid ester lipase [Lentinus tigrinus ALCF2SS1-6]RPD75761.1 carotenoid ester lipase [Lentinus tigrinus ALCF2SS1-7]
MAFGHIQLFILAFVAGSVFAAPSTGADLQPPPQVTLDDATVIGQPNGTVVKYLGLPFAQPPVGNLRLRLPEPVPPFNGTINATALGNQCIQQTFPPVDLPSDVPAAASEYLAAFVTPADVPQSEDCLNLNVIVPANATPESKLPVAVWIFGGGFQIGSNAIEPGEVVVARSIEIGYPIVYVAINYRLSAFGFLGGREVKEAGVANLGLHDQREAFRWIQKYISAFGGDPEKVMIWGESAGAISVALHMQANGGNTEGLFRAGFMESGSPVPSGTVDNPYLQSTYDQIVSDTGCPDATDTLQCLRMVPADVLKAAMDKTPSFLSFQQVNTPYFPRADGAFIPNPPERQLLSGPIANIPIVCGNDQDEGTAFAFPTLNLTTDEEFLDYVHANFYRNTSREAVAKILELYPSDPAVGAPYNTGSDFAYSPQYKRMASFQGDFIEQAPRRLFVQHLAEKQPVYSYLSNFHKVDGIGAAHGTELADVFGGGPMGDYLIRFAATLDPNGDGAVQWPRYTNSAPLMLTFNDAQPTFNVTRDTYREEEMKYLTKLSLADPM